MNSVVLGRAAAKMMAFVVLHDINMAERATRTVGKTNLGRLNQLICVEVLGRVITIATN